MVEFVRALEFSVPPVPHGVRRRRDAHSTCFWQKSKLKMVSGEYNDGEMEIAMTAYHVMRFPALRD